MFALKEKNIVSTYGFCGDRFAAISYISQIRNKINAADVYKAEYLREFKLAYINYIRNEKGFSTADNKNTKFMDFSSDVEGFEMAYDSSFFEPIVVIDVYEINNSEAIIFPRFGNFSGEYRDIIIGALEAETSICETELGEEYGAFPGILICSFPIKLNVEQLLTDEERDKLRAEAKAISEQSVFLL